MNKDIWYTTAVDVTGYKRFTPEEIRLATPEEIIKYELHKVKGSLVAGGNINLIFTKSKDAEDHLYKVWVNTRKSEVSLAKYRLKIMQEEYEKFTKSRTLEAIEAKKNQDYIDNWGGTNI